MIRQLDSLSRDIDATWHAMYRAKAQHDGMARAASSARKQLLDVGLDLFSRVRENAAGVLVCLSANKMLPAVTCYRAAFEGYVTLRYLTSHTQAEFEAQVAIAHYFVRSAMLEAASDSPDQEMLELANRIVDGLSMPEEVMSAAERRKGSFRWTGKTFEQVCAAASGSGDLYREHYKGLSSFTHPDAPAIALVDQPSVPAVEKVARLTRLRLRDAFTDFQRMWGIALADPWLDDTKTLP